MKNACLCLFFLMLGTVSLASDVPDVEMIDSTNCLMPQNPTQQLLRVGLATPGSGDWLSDFIPGYESQFDKSPVNLKMTITILPNSPEPASQDRSDILREMAIKKCNDPAWAAQDVVVWVVGTIDGSPAGVAWPGPIVYISPTHAVAAVEMAHIGAITHEIAHLLGAHHICEGECSICDGSVSQPVMCPRCGDDQCADTGGLTALSLCEISKGLSRL